MFEIPWPYLTINTYFKNEGKEGKIGPLGVGYQWKGEGKQGKRRWIWSIYFVCMYENR
jgi:hypothetical protein